MENMTTQEIIIIKSYLIELLKKFFPDFEVPKNNKLITCPICNEKESANLFPLNANKINCFNPDCKGSYDIFGLLRAIKPSMENLTDNALADYLVSFLKIHLTNTLDNLLKKYEQAGFALIPLRTNSKMALEDNWQKSKHKNKNVWKDWIDRGYNIGLNLGKVSNVIAIDIDSNETYEKVKHLLGDSLIQITKRGKHFLYNYDSDFEHINHKNLRTKGFEMEVRANNAYIVIAPSSVEGEVRTWNNQKIVDMPSKLKEFLFEHINSQKELTLDEDIQKSINEERIDNIDLSGIRNDSFIKLAGIFRKKLNKDQVKYVLEIISNNLIDKELPKKELYAILGQIEKYNHYDKEEMAKIILDRIEIIGQGSAFQIASSLRYEQKDVEEVLKYLEDEKKIFKMGKNYSKLKTVTWQEDFNNESIPIDFSVPYFSKYAYFNWQDMVIIGARSGQGKSHIVGNIMKQLVEQGKKPYLINTESGSRFGKIAQKLGLQIGDFYFTNVKHANAIELPDNAICIVDWLKAQDSDYARMDSTYEHLHEQLKKHNSFLIVMTQLRKDNQNFFAQNLHDFFATLVASYHYGDNDDNINTYFKTHKIRDSKTGMQYLTIPTTYNSDTKEVLIRK